MCSSKRRRMAAEILTILVSLINLGEELYIYSLAKLEKLDNEHEKLFFYVLLGISGISLFKALTVSQRKQIFISAVIEIGEAISYFVLFNGILFHFHFSDILNFDTFLQNNMPLFVISILLFIELLLLIISFIIVGSTEDKIPWFQRLRNFLIDIFLLSAINLPPALFLFLQSTSLFRNMYYELLTAISLYFAGEVNGILPCIYSDLYNYYRKSWTASMQRDETESDENDLETSERWKSSRQKKVAFKELFVNIKESLYKEYTCVYRYWFYFFILLNLFIFLPIFSITTIVYAAKQLADGNLPSYDRGLYIYSIVSFSFIILLYPIHVYSINVYCTQSKTH